MNKPKYKVTGFAKFFLFMIFFMPLAFLGIKTAQGKNPEEIWLSMKEKSSQLVHRIVKVGGNEDLNAKLIAKDEEIQKLREELFICQQAKK